MGGTGEDLSNNVVTVTDNCVLLSAADGPGCQELS